MRLARLLALAVMLVSSAALADGKKGDTTEDSVVLKNGTMVSGKILDDDPKTGVTIKLASGKVRVVPAAEVKLVERAMTPAEKAEKPKPEIAPAEAAPKPADKPDKPAPAEESASTSGDAYAHPGFRWGFGGELGVVLSRANSDGALKLLSPAFGLHAALDLGLTRKLYLRVDPTLATFSRSSEVPNVPNALNAPSADPATWTLFRYSSVATKLRLIELFTRVEAGWDFTPTLTSRVGFLVGMAVLSAKGDICASSTDLGVVYGLSLHPIAMRFGEKRALEVALGVDYASVPVKRCTTSVPDGYVPVVNALNQFQPVLLRDRIGVGTVGLGATYMLD